jgi:hypothetical protein
MADSGDFGHILEFEVVKEHHRMGWLSQTRILRITESAVENCKPDGELRSSGTSMLKTTKRLPFTSISRVAVNGSNKFCIRVINDHIYFYTAQNALEIAHEIQKRITAEKIVADIVEGSSEDTSMLMKSFCKGDLQLPEYSGDNSRQRGMTRIQTSRPDPASSSPIIAPPMRGSDVKLMNAAKERVYLETLSLRLEIFKAFRGGYFNDLSISSKKLLAAYQDEDVAFVSVSSLRSDIDTLKESLVEEILSPRSIKKFDGLEQEMKEDDDFVSRVADDILQEDIIKPINDFLWQSLLLQSDLVGQQHQYDKNAALIAQRHVTEFGITDSLLSIHFGLVTKSMQAIGDPLTTPTKQMDHLVHVAKSIVLTIEANSKLEVEKKRRASVLVKSSDSQTPPSFSNLAPEKHNVNTTLSADDVLPLYIYLLSKAAVPNVIFVREWVSKLGDPSECSERSYYLTVFLSAVEYILNGNPDAVALAKSPEVGKAPPQRRPLDSACSSVSIDLEDENSNVEVCSSSSGIEV